MRDYFSNLLRESRHAAWDVVVENKIPAFVIAILVPLFAVYMQYRAGSQTGKEMRTALITVGWDAAIYICLCVIFFLWFLFYVVPKRRLANAYGEIRASKERLREIEERLQSRI